jgi:hypothetical protein
LAGRLTILGSAERNGSRRPLAVYDNGLAIVEAGWIAPEFRAGLWAVGHLVWDVQNAPRQNYQLTARLLDWRGRVAAEQTMNLSAAGYPAASWRGGDKVRTPLAIPLPFTADGRYRLQISLTSEDGQPVPTALWGGHWASLGWVKIKAWPIVRQAPPTSSPPPEIVVFDERIYLAAYEWHIEERQVVVNLYWRSEGLIQQDPGIFVHVGVPDMPPLAQSSGGPANWTRPVSSWRPGEIVHDRHVILLPDAWSSYERLSLMVGFFLLDQPNIRLPLSVGGRPQPDAFYLLGDLP